MDVKDSSGLTPLAYATNREHKDVLALLGKFLRRHQS